MERKLHPSVAEFREFVKKNPAIVKEVRKGSATWQELYEDWYLLGENDQRWEPFKTKEQKASEEKDDQASKGDWMSNVMGMVKKMDPNQLQYHINNLSQALGAIQGVISQFQGSNPAGGNRGVVKPPEGPRHPFLFRKD